MSNMSYCRFNNTKRDLFECMDAIDNNEQRGVREQEDAYDMINRFCDWLCQHGIIDDYDDNAIIELLDQEGAW